MADSYDVFICHASEDKARFVEPLVAALLGQGLTVWYDRFEIGLGDDARLKLIEGLRDSRFGVVVVSPYFFKYWPQAELSALFKQEEHQDDASARRILPVRCDLTEPELTARDPILSGRESIGWEVGVDAIARQIAQVVQQVRPAPLARSPVYNVPRRRAQAFVGRDLDLERLDVALRKGGPIAVSASVEGLAGVGKTELALQMVDRLSATDRFPGGIFWFEADHPDLTSTWGGDVANALAIGNGPVPERAKAAVRVVASGGPALLVLDNVASWTRDAMPGPLPTGAHVAVLVTTREQVLGGPQAFSHLGIQCLAPAPARALLQAVAGRDLDHEPGVDALLAHLDGHALAIELAGAFLAAFPETTATTYLDRLQGGESVEDKVSAYVRYERTVKQALDAIWERLDRAARLAWSSRTPRPRWSYSWPPASTRTCGMHCASSICSRAPMIAGRCTDWSGSTVEARVMWTSAPAQPDGSWMDV